MNKITLTPRLRCVADLIGECGYLADIGTDHAYIPIYAVQNGQAMRAVASDVVKGPVKIAEKNVAEYALDEQIDVVLADGLERALGADVIVIAGMGGKLICDILSANLNIARSAKRLVLQPMTCVEDVRRFLHQNSFCVVDEKLAKEENKIYNVLVARCGEESVTDEFLYFVGKKLFENKDPLLPEYLHKKIAVLTRRANGMKNSDNPKVVAERKKVEALCKRFLEEADKYGESF